MRRYTDNTTGTASSTAGQPAHSTTLRATVAPIKASYPGVRRECAELGVCQGLEPPCQLCASHAGYDPSAYQVEPLLYWAAVAVLAVYSIAVLGGLAGFIWHRFF